jgi:HD-GYP domain-containing protein (c-di-GMP phosphodiesterase class II)
MDFAARLVGEARERRPRRMEARERTVVGASALAFAGAAALVMALVPAQRDPDPLLIVGLVFGYAIVSRVRFEVGSSYVVPEQLVFVPMLLLAPLPLVPFLVALGALLSQLPDFANGSWHRERWLSCLGDSWFAIGPVVVLALLAPGDPRLDLFWVYALAFGAQVATDLGAAIVRDQLIDRLPLSEILRSYAGVARIDAVLFPIAFMVAVDASSAPLSLLAIAPLVWLLRVFSRDRKERYAAALELNRAYRGTVMLLSDVVESDDSYTADHSRSVVDLVNATADELGVEPHDRQELEFAALLHDVGKISIPKEILNKPAGLTDREFELMKTHTLEGQVLLDQVGGLLARVGEIVRSCHERWDGAGYPDGLAGERIPLAARIVFACDAYNAMTTNRPYRAAMSTGAAVEELRANSGMQFDPKVVDAVTLVVERFEAGAVRSPAEDVRSVLAARPLPPRVGTAA